MPVKQFMARVQDATTAWLSEVNFQKIAGGSPTWDTERRQALIQSLLQGIPIGLLVYNAPDSGFGPNVGAPYLLDGQQRVESIRMFRRNQFGAPAEWFPSVKVHTGVAEHELMMDAGLATYDMLLPAHRAEFDIIVVRGMSLRIYDKNQAQEIRARLNADSRESV